MSSSPGADQMQQRGIERLGRAVGVVGLGTWQLGADWGDVADEAARSVVEAGVEHGVTCFDTAAVYGGGRIRAYGVSVETSQQALWAIARPGVATVQIILNCFRRKPLEQVLPAAREAGVGIIARVPLASGLLSGRYDEHTVFGPDDHRNYNRHGAAFDVGRPFSGVPFEVGVAAVRE